MARLTLDEIRDEKYEGQQIALRTQYRTIIAGTYHGHFYSDRGRSGEYLIVSDGPIVHHVLTSDVREIVCDKRRIRRR
jgi:hypothetical protein